MRVPGTILLMLLLSVGSVHPTEVKIFRNDSQSDFLAGTFDGISVDPLGTLRLADRAERLTAIEEPFLLSAAATRDGWILGTGNAGRVLHVDRKGEVSTLFAADEPEVFAVWAAPDGTVFAGSSPKGKVYRYRDGRAEVWFDPQQTYIWSVAGRPDGSLLVATGTEGKLFEVSSKDEGKLLYDSDDTHVRALLVTGDGRALVGTAGEGLVLEIDGEGRVRTLYDSDQPEIVAFAAGPGGEVYVAALASEASFIDLSSSAKDSESEGKESDDDEDGDDDDTPRPRITIEAGSKTSAGSRLASFRGPRAEILRVAPGDAVESIWKFSGETVYTLLFQRDRLWVGTGLEGKLYSYRDEKMVLEKDVDERQVVALLDDRPGPAFATTNAAALYRLTGGTERQGTYTSPILDADSIARFGTLHWTGDVAAGTTVRFAVRSGVSSEPDRTWSSWSETEEGREISLRDVPRGRYVQWRATLEAADGRSPQIHGIELSYLQDNQRPEIESLEVLDPGQILVPSNFNPSSQVFEPAHPNREGIFTTLEASTDRAESKRLKKLWKLGYLTLQWEASDPNGDDLVYRLSFRREEGEEEWLPLADDVDESHLSFDATVLPDGRYRFRLEADDRPDNTPEGALVAERISSTVIVDHGDPVLEEVRRASPQLRVTVRDDWSPLREAVFSVDAGPWKSARSADGLLDGRREVLILDVPEDAKLVLLRLTDAAHNVVTIDVSRAAGPR